VKKLLSFIIGMLVFGLLFFALDYALMNMQGLSLVYQP